MSKPCNEVYYEQFGKTREDGKEIGGRGRINRFVVIQNFHRCTNQTNKEDELKGSMKAWGVLAHYSTTIEKHLHDNCLKDPPSWCLYQQGAKVGAASYKQIISYQNNEA